MKQFDYATPTIYFVTICTHDKACLFGQPEQLNILGRIAQKCIQEITVHFPNVQAEKYVVMPNHIHMLISFSGERCSTLSTIVGSYKSNVSRQIHQIDPDIRLWQRSFHDHVIRNERSYQHIWQYIDENPYRWKEDMFFTDIL